MEVVFISSVSLRIQSMDKYVDELRIMMHDM